MPLPACSRPDDFGLQLLQSAAVSARSPWAGLESRSYRRVPGAGFTRTRGTGQRTAARPASGPFRGAAAQVVGLCAVRQQLADGRAPHGVQHRADRENTVCMADRTDAGQGHNTNHTGSARADDAGCALAEDRLWCPRHHRGRARQLGSKRWVRPQMETGWRPVRHGCRLVHGMAERRRAGMASDRIQALGSCRQCRLLDCRRR